MILGNENNQEVYLRKINKNDIEKIRQWRNDPKISKFMYFKDYITSEMQQKWYNSIDNKNNYYFIIVKDDIDIGLTEVKKINYDNLHAEAGIFIFEDNYLNATISYESILLLMDFSFNTLKIKKFNIQVLSTNKRAIRFNKSLGYKEDKKDCYSLTQKDYEAHKHKIVKIIKIAKGK